VGWNGSVLLAGSATLPIRGRCPTRSDCLLGPGDLVGLVEPGEVLECPGTWIECELGWVQAVVLYAKCLKIAAKD